jgi:CHAP domain
MTTSTCPIEDQCVAYVERFVNLPPGIPAAKDIPAAVEKLPGWSVVALPVVGALAVWQPGHGGADQDGHVAIVTAVQTTASNLPLFSGLSPTVVSFTVNEQNFTGPSGGGCGVVDTRTVPFLIGDVQFVVAPADAAAASPTAGASAPLYTLTGTEAGAKAGIKQAATSSWGWAKSNALPFGVAAVMLWILFAPRKGRS